MSDAVVQRRQEMGIRIALGADGRPSYPRRLSGHAGGLAVGIVAALATVRVVKTLLFGVISQDRIAIAVLACFVPASRAARVDPIIALRGE